MQHLAAEFHVADPLELSERLLGDAGAGAFLGPDASGRYMALRSFAARSLRRVGGAAPGRSFSWRGSGRGGATGGGGRGGGFISFRWRRDGKGGPGGVAERRQVLASAAGERSSASSAASSPKGSRMSSKRGSKRGSKRSSRFGSRRSSSTSFRSFKLSSFSSIRSLASFVSRGRREREERRERERKAAEAARVAKLVGRGVRALEALLYLPVLLPTSSRHRFCCCCIAFQKAIRPITFTSTFAPPFFLRLSCGHRHELTGLLSVETARAVALLTLCCDGALQHAALKFVEVVQARGGFLAAAAADEDLARRWGFSPRLLVGMHLRFSWNIMISLRNQDP